MDARRLIPLILWIALSIGSPPIRAQRTLESFVTVSGVVPANGADTWQFSATEGAVISLYVEGENGFDPIVQLFNSTGVLISENDDFNYPTDTAALLQAVTLPRTDQYTVIITGFEGNGGTYSLQRLNGYAIETARETFEGEPNWATTTRDLIIDQAGGQLALALSGIQQSAYANNTVGETFGNFYAHTEIQNVNGRNGWITGLTLRQTGNQFYALTLNHLGQWRMILWRNGVQTVIRDWTNHPAIPAGQDRFSFGVLANGRTFDVFYNNAFVGQAIDQGNTLSEGRVGIMVQTINAPNSQTQVSYDALIITTPYQLDGQEILPTMLAPGGQALITQELERRRVIPSGGQVALNAAESFAQQINAGVNRQILARGTTFEDVVISTTVTWRSATSGLVGCGIVFGNLSESEHSLAYLDQLGGYGISDRDGEQYAPGIFGDGLTFAQTDQQLLIVRVGENVHYYINRRYVGTAILPPRIGEIGIAAVNFEPIDTTCEFRDTWVWRIRP
ncbi:MAG: hypothetical protein MUF87_07185 [Anaerolineae bacterium]|jgi:energy-coupling factor transporter ATP-binding protein EcfA2|nr:hypothetical protein [Anaerolineae bacterium]